MDNPGSSGDSAAESSGSARREESSRGFGAQSELPVYLTYLPESYCTAKFSLAAYLLCWALLRWYQKLRCQSAPLQNRRGVESECRSERGNR
ncbi:hypothetical protein EPR50_G00220920 [Perca flavescens]|uniref:Uncharacterized protein n=1 Tax=Perca flavescens TaxID=8167 RepID=A0A484C039_PERFV|nr:hypothetical protein EPR50_G00220920 [Perca flavescens]